MNWLWVDDIRKPPGEGWHWAKTYDEAMAYLAEHKPHTVALDHDLDYTHYVGGITTEKHGHDLARAMCESGHLPERIIVHSRNVVGSENIVREFQRLGYQIIGYADPRCTDMQANPQSPVLQRPPARLI